MNNNWHEYDFSMEILILHCSKPFHFRSKDTHITFLLINFSNKRHINMNGTFEVIVCFVIVWFHLLLRAVSAQHPRRKGAHVKY